MVLNAAEAVDNAHVWFEANSGWAPPDPDTLAEWVADGVCRCPDECLVAPGAWCEHGLASWWLVLDALSRTDQLDRMGRSRAGHAASIAAHRRAVAVGEPGYTDPGTGLFVMTARYLWQRGYCCDQGCRHCPFPDRA